MKSMTGFGRARLEISSGNLIDIEVKSVNHRFLEVACKYPKVFSSGLEIQIRKLISQKLKRGKIDVSISMRSSSNQSDSSEVFRSDLFDRYADIFGQAISRGKLAGGQTLSEEALKFILSQPGVMNINDNSSELDAEFELELNSKVLQSIGTAIDELIRMRQLEGDSLGQAISDQLNSLQQQTSTISRLNSGAAQIVSDKLRVRVHELLNQIDNSNTDSVLNLQQRIAQELVLISDKVDVTEEISRLDSHLQQFQQKIDGAAQSNIAIGRELDFICQEIGRECNTIGSKSQMIEISKIVIESKVILEQIREQIQNIE